MEKAHQEVLAPSKCDVTCSVTRASTLAFNYGQQPKLNDKPQYIREDGIMTLYAKQKTSHGRKIVNGGWPTGQGSVVLYQSTKFRHRDIDLVCKSERLGQLWNENPSNLQEIGFHLEESVCVDRVEIDAQHQPFYGQFNSLPVRQVTILSNTKEWHLGR